jgi:inner membrane transporter RhtA
VLAAICSVQLGAAFAKVLFEDLGPAGTVLLRTAFAAIILLAVWRPWRSLTASGFASATTYYWWSRSASRWPR